jgi:CubicO group peptidase (beta-lactamase class C family)
MRQRVSAAGRTGLLMTALALAAAPAPAQAPQSAVPAAAPEFPATPIGETARAFIEAMNGGDAARRAAWAENLPTSGQWGQPLEKHRAFLDLLWAQSGGFEVRELQADGDPVRMTVRARSDGAWARLYMGFDDATGKPLGVGLYRIPDPDRAGRPWPEGAVSREEVVRQIALHVQDRVDEDRFSGVVLVAKGDSVVFHRAYGLAERSFGVPNRPDTKFNLGSMNKMFTAIAIAQLVEAGKLKFTDTLANVLPEYPNRELARRITLHHLLTHTSGLGGDIFVPELWRERSKYRKPSDYFPLFAGEAPRFEPGTRWDYSNAGFVVLGAVVEKVSGQSYFDYVREHVYRPAGMTDTDAYELTRVVPNLAVGYAFFDDDPMQRNERRNNWDFLPFQGSPAGGGYSTAMDLFRFSRALRAHRLLSPEMTEVVTGGKVVEREGSPVRYGYGFEARPYAGKEARGHSGGGSNSGINSDLEVLWDSDWTVVAMGNYDAPAAQSLAREILGFLATQ